MAALSQAAVTLRQRALAAATPMMIVHRTENAPPRAVYSLVAQLQPPRGRNRSKVCVTALVGAVTSLSRGATASKRSQPFQSVRHGARL